MSLDITAVPDIKIHLILLIDSVRGVFINLLTKIYTFITVIALTNSAQAHDKGLISGRFS